MVGMTGFDRASLYIYFTRCLLGGHPAAFGTLAIRSLTGTSDFTLVPSQVLVLSLFKKTALRRFFILVGMTGFDRASLYIYFTRCLLGGHPAAFGTLAIRSLTGTSDFTLVPSQVLILSFLKKTALRRFFYFGRDDRIRTCGLCVPNATLYQAEPHPVTQNILPHFYPFVYR